VSIRKISKPILASLVALVIVAAWAWVRLRNPAIERSPQGTAHTSNSPAPVNDPPNRIAPSSVTPANASSPGAPAGEGDVPPVGPEAPTEDKAAAAVASLERTMPSASAANAEAAEQAVESLQATRQGQSSMPPLPPAENAVTKSVRQTMPLPENSVETIPGSASVVSGSN
jgi:cytoskeletal protein RodZ